MTPDQARRVLGVDADAPPERIRTAWRKLAAALHPDRNPDPHAAEHLAQVNTARDTLLRGRGSKGAAASPGATGAAGPGAADGWEGMEPDWARIFETVLGRNGFGAGGFASDFGRAGGGEPVRRARVPLAVWLWGGRVRVGSTIAALPAGAIGPMALRTPEGVVALEEAPDAVYQRVGARAVVVDLAVPMADAALGGTVAAPDLGGRSVRFDIPSGTPAGAVLVAALEGGVRVLARVTIAVPKRLNAAQRAALEAFRNGTPVPKKRAARRRTRTTPTGGR